MAGAKSSLAGTFYCASTSNPHNYLPALHNTPILVECKAFKHVVCSAVEAECDGLFHNSQTAMGIQNILEEI
eukprot:10232686-Ditylum_brightwellii.AAC.1